MNNQIVKKTLALCLVAALTFGVAAAQKASAASIAPTAKNVIMMIPDGMSIGASTLARYMLNEKGDVSLALDEYVTAMVKTRWANGPITDSAPAGTAYAIGYKSISGALGVDSSLLPRANVLEAAQLKGKATGLISTSEFMHATPAAYSSHEAKRSNYVAIAEQMLNQELDVLLGTGAGKLDKKVLDIIGLAESKGYTILDDRSELLTTKANRVWGNFTATIGGMNNLSYDLDRNQSVEPSLAEMTTKAIELLNRDKDGFFLMVEGSKIDWAAHANDTIGIVTDTLAFDKAFKAAVDFAKADGNTIVIAVTDHGNSGITIGNSAASASYDKDLFSIFTPIKGATKTAEGAMALVDATKSEASLNSALNAYGINPADTSIATEIAAFKADPKTANLVKTINKKCAIGYSTFGHTGEDVPLYIYAPAGVKLPKGLIDNTDVADFVANSMGLNMSDATSKLFVDVTAMGTINEETKEFTFNTTGGKLVKIKPNQSVASVDGVAVDLDGQVAVYINKRFYAPKLLVDIANTTLTLSARYNSGVSNPDGGVAEIVKFNADNKKFYVVNGTTKKLDIVSLGKTADGSVAKLTADQSINVAELISKVDKKFIYGDLTSVDIDTHRNVIAVAVQAKDYDRPGKIALLNYSGKLIRLLTVGVQPDMLTFTPDHNSLLVANEGEPRQGYGTGTTDPKGSVTIVNLKKGVVVATATTIDFTSFNASRSQLVTNKVILKKNTMPSVDLEPEYIAVSADSKTAYVSLQEANAIATLNIATKRFTGIRGLGFKDYGLAGNAIDMYRDGTINIKAEAGYMGIYMPDGIATFEQNGKTYLLTANEGDSRDWNGYINELDVTLSKTGQDGKTPGKAIKVTTFNSADFDGGFDPAKKYLYGGRSFSIWDAETMKQVYDSGNLIETVTANRYPTYFNWSNDDNVMDKRSAKKGPEPEDVKVGIIAGKPYAFVGLERIGGVMTFDLSDLLNVKYGDYINTRDFSDTIKGDVSPEGLCFIPAENSPTGLPMVLVANEVSGTVAAFVVNTSAGVQANDK